ncbi:YcaO-like family protein [Streptomyces fructofermentans]|uniref:YcaO-like family protein n=1 Tax=Streptomyces fructofermentans TaxID=152141 RepID=UPI0037A44007
MPSARFDDIASTRPRIKRDVLFTETPDGVLFHNADGGFRLTAKSAYRFATLLVPHLNGDHTVADLCRGMGDKQRAMVGDLVGTLYERGFARSVASVTAGTASAPGAGSVEGDRGPEPDKDVMRRFEAQIAYIDHYADDANRRFQRFRDARVAVVGDDATARWCVLSLVRNGNATVGVLPGLALEDITEAARAAGADGCPVDVRPLVTPADGRQSLTWAELADYDVVVVTGGPDAPHRLFPLLRAGVPAGRTLIPAWSFGRWAVVGPSTAVAPSTDAGTGTAGCWACALLRWGANDGAAEAADVWRSLALGLAGTDAERRPGSPPAAPSRPRTPTQGAHPGGPLAAMLGNLLGYEVFRLTTGALPGETTGQVIIQDVESLDVTSETLLPHPSCPWCASDPEPVPDEVRLPAAEEGGREAFALPTVATARDADALVDELNRRSVLLNEHTGVFTRYADESITQTPLKLSVVELGLGHGRRLRVGAADVHHVAGARMRALHRAAETYAEHVVPARPAPGATDSTGGAPSRVGPEHLSLHAGSGTTDDVRDWALATSLLGHGRFLVPTQSVRPFGPDNRGRLFEATSAGMRAGASVGAAAADGLLSALAHDALARAVRGAAVARVVPDEVADPELTFLVRSAANLGVDFDLLDLGEREHSGAAAVLARSGARWAVAADLSWRAAAASALRDLLAGFQFEQQGEEVSFGDPVLRELDPRAVAVAVSTDVPPADATDAADWPDVLRRLGEQGRDALVVETGSADLARAGVRVVRVLLTSEAPGAGH